MKIAVCGTPDLAAHVFEAIRASEKVEVVAAVTMPDAPAGRGKKLTASPVKQWAEVNGIPVWHPEKADEEFAQQLKNSGIELMIVIAYGRIFSEKFLNAAPSAWNLHLSMLPKYRGTSPVQAAILNGDADSGVTVFRICPGMDDGPIVGQKAFSIADDRADQVTEKIIAHGSTLLIDLLHKKVTGETIAEIPQDDSRATYCQKVSKDDGKIDPQTDLAELALRKIRAYYPWPSAWFEWSGKRVKLLNAIFPPPQEGELEGVDISPALFTADKSGLYLGFANGALEITEIQPEGKRAMTGKEFGSGLR